ncbi:MAG: hypothetical protein U0R24_10030 [Solirubrobacterales bacterium]
MERWLGAHGITIDDTRDQPNVGADGVDRDQDLYFELKAHVGEPNDIVRLESSQAQRAREKKGRFWLVIASGLLEGSEPKLLFIPDPLDRLDTHLASGIRLGLSIKSVKAGSLVGVGRNQIRKRPGFRAPVPTRSAVEGHPERAPDAPRRPFGAPRHPGDSAQVGVNAGMGSRPPRRLKLVGTRQSDWTSPIGRMISLISGQ